MKTPLTAAHLSESRWSAHRRESPASAAAGDFAAAVSAARRDTGVVVRQGDNLTHLVKAQARAQGVTLDESTAYRLALQVAQSNGIAQADRIEPGQRVDLQAVQHHLGQLRQAQASAAAPVPVGAQQWLAHKQPATAMAPAPAAARAAGASEVLDRTLQRAVDKGFLPAAEQATARQRIHALADKYGFAPDDFAVMSLMESDGLNPQASNGSCHGVIQFCEGPNRGAASVGMAAQPRAILGMGVLQQLDLVDRYLADAGVQRGAGLDDLYLAVLTPAARSQPAWDAPLPIAGRQASALYVAGNPAGVITRRSLTQGLLENAAARLGMGVQELVALRQGQSDSQLALNR